jgi:hypothetical protein
MRSSCLGGPGKLSCRNEVVDGDQIMGTTDEAAAIDSRRDSEPASRQADTPFIVMAVLSAFASAYLPGSSFNFAGFDMLPPPGIYFGLALGLGTWLWRGRGIIGGAIVLASTFVGWLVAFEVAMRVTALLNAIGIREIAGIDIQNFVAGVIAGAIGAGITFSGACFAAPDLWSTRRLHVLCAAGAVLGLLLDPAIEGDGSLLILLFLPWQITVATLIGRYMSRPVTSTD